MAKRWYIIHTYSGFEDKVKEDVEQRILAMNMQDTISQVLIPRGNVMELKKGKREVVSKKFYPGYLLIEMEMTNEAWHVVRNSPKVTGFVGQGDKPSPLSPKEVARILDQMKEGESTPKPEVMFTDGEIVKIIDGPFVGFSGKVEQVNPERGTLKATVSIFGRATPVELDFLQVGKP
ncbi:MAG: transcription termination/antitermination protein NusG [bacterium]